MAACPATSTDHHFPARKHHPQTTATPRLPVRSRASRLQRPPAPTDTPVVLAPGAKYAPPPPVITTPIGRTSVQIKSGPATLQAGLSGTYVVTVTNTFTDAKPVRISVIFAGKLEQTGPVNAQGGLDCVVGHDVGINAAVNCTGPIPQGSYDIVVQGRGSAPGAGQLLAKLDNDTKQQNVTIT